MSLMEGARMGLFDKKIRIAEYIHRYTSTVKRSRAYIRVYENVARKIEALEQEANAVFRNDNFGYKELDAFVDMLNRQGLRRNTISNIVSKLKFVLSLLIRDMYKVNSSVFQYRCGGEFVPSVFLSQDEIKRLYSHDFREKAARTVVDLFVVGCYTGMRYSDYSTLTADNISGGFIVKKTRKTGVVVKIPIHPIVREILTRHGGFPRYGKSKQNFNKVLKSAARRVGIDEAVLVEYTKGGKIMKEVRRKYEMVASHTARRSFATNAYLAGIPIARIMMLTGHQSETSFFKYIKIRGDENAEELARHSFFAASNTLPTPIVNKR